jgi:hypothetical protein
MACEGRRFKILLEVPVFVASDRPGEQLPHFFSAGVEHLGGIAPGDD